MARPRTPTSQLEASGAFDHDPQRRAARENEPVPSGPLGDPPAHLTRVQQVVWRELAAQVPAGVLTIADRMLVEIYCSLVARHRGGDPGPDEEPNPPEVLKSGEYNLIISILSRMGLTPSDRSRVDAPTDPKRRAKDTFAQLASTPRGSHVKQ